MRYAFAGDRQISCNILQFLISKGYKPLALIVSEGKNESHSDELIGYADLADELVFYGNDFKKRENIDKLQALELDYIFGIHFPYIVPADVLKVPKVGFLNIHPAFLPFNKGWHTPSWAIIDGTPYGATLHFMTEDLDRGDIIRQEELTVLPCDNANSLYKKVLRLEEEVFKNSFHDLVSLNPPRTAQVLSGTSHVKSDLKKTQEIRLEDNYIALDLINKMRALSTNNDAEAVYFKINDKKIGIKVELFELDD